MDFYGLLGERLSHSISPDIHEEIFSILNVNGTYKIFEIEKSDIGKFCDSLRLLNIKGVNVTIPYKEVVMNYLDSISDEARKIGAVNTIHLKGGKLNGYNSDYFGFETIIKKYNVELEGKIAMVLGTGGASKAVVTYILDKGIRKIYLVSRSYKKESYYKDDRVECITYEEVKKVKGDIIINTTPVGMYPKIGISPVDEEVIENFETLIDIIYNPRITKFLELGKKLNKKICGGLEMLVGQAIRSEEIWQDVDINDEVFDRVFSKINGNFK